MAIVSVAEVVRESLLSLANLRGVIARKPALRERLATLAREFDGLGEPLLFVGNDFAQTDIESC